MGSVHGAVADDGGLPSGPHEHAVDRSQRSDADRADRQPADQRLRAGRQRPADVGLEHRRRLRLSGRVRHQRDDRGRGPARRWARCRTTRCRCGTTTRFSHECRRRLGVIYRTDMFAAIDNTVTLPGYTRVDAAGFYSITRQSAAAGERREPVRQDATTSTPTATPTSRPAFRARCGSG